MSPIDSNHDRAVHDRYSEAARSREGALCCPVDYDARFLDVIPDEILERDYGCGDPSRHLRPGETVLDLGSGAGKICYIAAQIVGATGRVIGIDRNDAMLALARKHQPAIRERLGYDNVRFHKARIEDLALDLERLDAHLHESPVGSAEELDDLERWRDDTPWRIVRGIEFRSLTVEAFRGRAQGEGGAEPGTRCEPGCCG